MHNKALFVTGTDTGVGKTLVTALLALRVRQLGIDCGVLKPFASGCEWRNGTLISEDAEFLLTALQLTDSHDEICPIRLEEPLAPLIAARRAGISTEQWPQTAREAFEHLQQKHEFVIVEGVGGLLAPIWEQSGTIGSNLELINHWALPTVVVARRALGTINHTLLTLRTPLTSPAHFAAIIWNDSALTEENNIAAQTSPDFVKSVVNIPSWGQIPLASNFENHTLQALASQLEIRGIGAREAQYFSAHS